MKVTRNRYMLSDMNAARPNSSIRAAEEGGVLYLFIHVGLVLGSPHKSISFDHRQIRDQDASSFARILMNSIHTLPDVLSSFRFTKKHSSSLGRRNGNTLRKSFRKDSTRSLNSSCPADKGLLRSLTFIMPFRKRILAKSPMMPLNFS